MAASANVTAASVHVVAAIRTDEPASVLAAVRALASNATALTEAVGIAVESVGAPVATSVIILAPSPPPPSPPPSAPPPTCAVCAHLAAVAFGVTDCTPLPEPPPQQDLYVVNGTHLCGGAHYGAGTSTCEQCLDACTNSHNRQL